MRQRKNVTWEYQKLSTKDLTIDTLYQRDLDKKRVGKIVREYDPCLSNIVKVSYRDRRYYIFDGQHTVAAEKLIHGKGTDVIVDCKVFHGLTRLDEMELFVQQNGVSSAVRANDKYKALFNLGDKDVVGMVRAAELAGIRIDFRSSVAPNKVVALSTLMKSYLKLDRTAFIEMLSCLRESWDGISESFTGEILKGMALFFQTYYGDFNVKELSKSLSRTSPSAIVREAKGYGVSHQNATYYARIILREYNKRRRSKILEDRL